MSEDNKKERTSKVNKTVSRVHNTVKKYKDHKSLTTRLLNKLVKISLKKNLKLHPKVILEVDFQKNWKIFNRQPDPNLKEEKQEVVEL